MQKIAREKKQTFVMVTHDNYLAGFGDRIINIRDGKILSITDNRKTEPPGDSETVAEIEGHDETMDNTEISGNSEVPESGESPGNSEAPESGEAPGDSEPPESGEITE